MERGRGGGRTQMGLPLKFLEGSCQGRRKIRTFRLSALDKSAFWPKEIVSEINSSKLILRRVLPFVVPRNESETRLKAGPKIDHRFLDNRNFSRGNP